MSDTIIDLMDITDFANFTNPATYVATVTAAIKQSKKSNYAKAKTPTYPALVKTFATSTGTPLKQAEHLWDLAVAAIEKDNPKLSKTHDNNIFFGLTTKKFKTLLGVKGPNADSPTTDPKASDEEKHNRFVNNMLKSKDPMLSGAPVKIVDKAAKLAMDAVKRKGAIGQEFHSHTMVLLKSLVHKYHLGLNNDPKQLVGKNKTAVIKKIATAFDVDVKDILRYFKDAEAQFADSDYQPGTEEYTDQVLLLVLRRAEFKRKKLARGDLSVTSSSSVEELEINSSVPVEVVAEEGSDSLYKTLNPAQTVYQLIVDFDPSMFLAVGASNLQKQPTGLKLDVAGNTSFNGTITILREGNDADGPTYTLTCLDGDEPVRRMTGINQYELAPYLFKAVSTDAPE